MSEQNENTKLVVEQLKKLNSNFNTFNKIMSSFLVIKTIESNVVKTLTDKDIATITPIATEKLKTMNKNIYDN